MPAPKGPSDLIEELKKNGKNANESARTLDILDRLAEDEDLTVEFIVDSPAGSVVKGLRSHTDEKVRKKAAALTKRWKDLVKEGLDKAEKAKKERGKAASQGDDVLLSILFAISAIVVGVESYSMSAAGLVAAGGSGSSSGSFTFASPRQGEIQVLDERVRPRNCAEIAQSEKGKAVVYWMGREQRVQDNWAMLYAQQRALEAGSPLLVCFTIGQEWDGEPVRHVGFMLEGLKEVEAELQALRIPFLMLRGDCTQLIPRFIEDNDAGLLVTDFSPLKFRVSWGDHVAQALKQLDPPVPMHEVDAHNVVPIWEASNKQEVGARTLRPKITKQLPKYLKPFPQVAEHPHKWAGEAPAIDFAKTQSAIKCDMSVPMVSWATPGTQGGLDNLRDFLTVRLGKYDGKRNDPFEDAQSDMAPWLNFGQVSAQRCALEAKAFQKKHSDSVAGFIEELVVRRELSDNFCHHNKLYDSLEGCAAWAQETLRVHAADKRSHEYTLPQLESGKTHDELWNAAQQELVHRGKMHGFMRMYWAKKILEWTPSPEEALSHSIFLNDKYSLDGRDPNGFVGCMWSIGGVHDMGWKERPVFGKIRYMNYDGCKRKFNIAAYVGKIRRLIPKKGG